MAINGVVASGPAGIADAHLARISSDGSAQHPHLAALLQSTGAASARDLADAVHLLCQLHGRFPGLVAIVLQQCGDGVARNWLSRAADAFEEERLYLVRLTSAVGPLPSTPGAAESEAALSAQRNALEILANSERRGCGLGAACALIGDWSAVRRLLDRAAARASLPSPAPSIPGEASVIEVIGRACEGAAFERALSFGSEQLLLQHRALFDLLEARAEARQDY